MENFKISDRLTIYIFLTEVNSVLSTADEALTNLLNRVKNIQEGRTHDSYEGILKQL